MADFVASPVKERNKKRYHEVGDIVQVVNGNVPLRVVSVIKGGSGREIGEKGQEESYIAEIIAGEDIGEKYLFGAYQIEPFEGLRKSAWPKHLWEKMRTANKEYMIFDAEKQ